MKAFFASLTVFVFSVAHQAFAIDLINEGKSDYVIALVPNASPSEAFAAEELALHLKMMSGVELKVERTAHPPAKAIVLGVPVAQVDKTLGDDGYTIRVDGEQLMISGGKLRGTLYGVYTFLEQLGVRWWTPQETFVPQLKTVAIPAMNLREVPKLEYRDMMYRFVFDPDGQRWCVRNKLNGMAWAKASPKYGDHYAFANNLVHGGMATIKKSGVPFAEEMKALINGKRTGEQFCLTSPATLDAMVKGVLKIYEENPATRFVVIGQQDNMSYCRCEKCAAIDAQEESHSGQNIWFANQVAEAVEKQRPGSFICTAAYQWSRKPPKTLKPRENVFITLCSIECDFSRPLATATNEVNKAFREDFVAWGKICPRLYIWDYVVNYDQHLAPFPNLDAMVPNIRFFAENGALGVFGQAAHKAYGTESVGLRSWVLAKALWNPSLDGRKLVEEFVTGYYGAAAPHILASVDALHEPARQKDFVMTITSTLAGPYLDPDVIAKAEVALRRAEQTVAGNPDLERRVHHAHMPIWYILAKRGPGSPLWKTVNEVLGKDDQLDLSKIAAGFVQVAADYRISIIADGEVLGPWQTWLQDYAKLCADGKYPVPPELKDKDLSKIHLVQGCQFETRGRWYTKAEGASDGWGAKQMTAGWTTICALDDPNHFAAGKSYRLAVRAKAEVKPGAKGRAWEGGVWRPRTKGAPVQVKVDAEQAKDGQWHVYDLGVFKPEEGDRFYFNPVPAVCKEVIVDCLWLEEVPAS